LGRWRCSLALNAEVCPCRWMLTLTPTTGNGNERVEDFTIF
jgi:hypothetical protein